MRLASSEVISGLARIIYPIIVAGMQGIQDIFGIWPSINSMAEALSEKPDTVLRWKLRRRIPEHIWPKLIERSAELNRPVTADDLLVLNAPMGRRGRPPVRKVVRLRKPSGLRAAKP